MPYENKAPDKIYALFNGGNGKMFYVGATSQHPLDRLAEHLIDDKHPEKLAYIQSLAERGVPVFIGVLEYLQPGDDWELKEMQWIEYGRRQNPNLLNRSDGGKGDTSPRSDQQKTKIANSLKGHEVSEATRRRQSEALAGTKSPAAKLTPEDIAAIRAAPKSVKGRELAREYKVNEAQISRIRNNKTYKQN